MHCRLKKITADQIKDLNGGRPPTSYSIQRPVTWYYVCGLVLLALFVVVLGINGYDMLEYGIKGNDRHAGVI